MRTTALALASLAMYLPGTAAAQILFQDGLSDGAAWSVEATSADTASTFGYDYSADGIPAAPNGSDTVGLKLEANLADGAAAEISASPTDFSVGGLYRVEFDFWINANGPFPGGGGGSTEFAGGAVGHDTATAGRDGASLLISGEGGASRDWRLYKDTSEQFIESGQYSITDNNASGTELASAFPGQDPPALQQTNFAQQTGTLQDGAGGFQWLTMQIDVDSDAGTAAFRVSSAASGNTLHIGTIDSNIGDPVDLSGNIALVYADLFSSVSDNAALSFGVFDNVVVTQIPEPSSVALLALGAAGFFQLRRRIAARC